MEHRAQDLGGRPGVVDQTARHGRQGLVDEREPVAEAAALDVGLAEVGDALELDRRVREAPAERDRVLGVPAALGRIGGEAGARDREPAGLHAVGVLGERTLGVAHPSADRGAVALDDAVEQRELGRDTSGDPP